MFHLGKIIFIIILERIVMKTHSSFNGMALSIKIEGHITGMSEVMEIKNIVSQSQGTNAVELVIEDAFVIPSALIGYLVKLVNFDKKKVIIKAKQQELKNLIIDLNLDQIFDMR